MMSAMMAQAMMQSAMLPHAFAARQFAHQQQGYGPQYGQFPGAYGSSFPAVSGLPAPPPPPGMPPAGPLGVAPGGCLPIEDPRRAAVDRDVQRRRQLDEVRIQQEERKRLMDA